MNNLLLPFLLSILLVPLSYRIFRGVLAPATLYAGIWCFLLSLYILDLFPGDIILTTVSVGVALLISLSLVAFFLGSVLSGLYITRKPKTFPRAKPQDVFSSFAVFLIGTKRLYYALLVVSLLLVLFYFTEVYNSILRGFDFDKDQDLLRSALMLPEFDLLSRKPYFFQTMQATIVISLLWSSTYIACYGFREKFVYLPWISVFIFTAAYMGRGKIIDSATIFLFAVLYTRASRNFSLFFTSRIPKRKIFNFGMLSVILMTVSFYLVSFTRTSEKGWGESNFLVKQVYSYFTGAITSFEMFYRQDFEGSYGWYTFNIFYYIGDYLLNSVGIIKKTFLVPIRYGIAGEDGRVFTQLTPSPVLWVYDDFGVSGVAIVFFLVGFMATYNYISLQIYSRPRHLWITLLFLLFLIKMWGTLIFYDWWWWMALLFVLALQKYRLR